MDVFLRKTMTDRAYIIYVLGHAMLYLSMLALIEKHFYCFAFENRLW